MTVDSAGHSERPEHTTPSVEALFEGSAPVGSAEDLARDGVFDDDELEEFLTDLAAMRRADLA